MKMELYYSLSRKIGIWSLILLAVCAGCKLQAQVLSALPSTNQLTVADIVPVVENGATYKTAISNLFKATGNVAAWQLPSGISGQRPANSAGIIRWSTTDNRFEINTGSAWKNFVYLDGDTMSGTLTAPTFLANGTAAIQVPNGTTAQRPADSAGLIRFNSTTGRFEHNIGASWENWVRVGGDTMTGPLNVIITNLTTITAPAMTLSNSTAATVGVQVQDGPALYMSGNAWLTGSASNAPVIFRSYVVAVAGASAPTATWTLDRSLNGAAFGGALTYDSAGALTANGNISAGTSIAAGGNVTAGAGNSFYLLGRSGLSSSANGAMEMNNNGGSARSTLQANIPQITKTANYTIVALDSGLRFVNIGAVATNRLDLPTAAAGMHFNFYVDAAFNMQVQATGTDVIREGSTVSAAAGDIHSSTVGSTLHLFSPKAGLWVVDAKDGVWVGPQVTWQVGNPSGLVVFFRWLRKRTKIKLK